VAPKGSSPDKLLVAHQMACYHYDMRNKKQTGKAAASEASKELRSKQSGAGEKKVAASDLSQAPIKKTRKK